MRRLSMMGWTVAALACLACARADRGMLQPLADPGVLLVSTQGLPGDTARLAAGGVTADVTGAWSSSGPSVEVVYRGGAVPARVPVAPTLTWRGRTTSASHAWDTTAAVPGNAVGRPLLAGSLTIGRRERRRVQIEFSGAGDGPTIDDEVTVAVPMPDRARPVRFKLSPE